MTDSPTPLREEPSLTQEQRVSWHRPVGLALVAVTVFMAILICSTAAIDRWHTKVRRTIVHRGHTYSAWISSKSQGYYLYVEGNSSSQMSGSVLIASEADLSEPVTDYAIEWQPEKGLVTGRIGALRGTILLK